MNKDKFYVGPYIKAGLSDDVIAELEPGEEYSATAFLDSINPALNDFLLAPLNLQKDYEYIFIPNYLIHRKEIGENEVIDFEDMHKWCEAEFHYFMFDSGALEMSEFCEETGSLFKISMGSIRYQE